uniref:Uncharacterized protein n=1 Tax=Romanomermis culicivorax TaxID=13658 RepID=A0A915HLZ5_ROMCU
APTSFGAGEKAAPDYILARVGLRIDDEINGGFLVGATGAVDRTVGLLLIAANRPSMQPSRVTRDDKAVAVCLARALRLLAFFGNKWGGWCKVPPNREVFECF